MNITTLEDWVKLLLAQPIEELEHAYPNAPTAAEELLPLRRQLQQDEAAALGLEKYLHVADNLIETLHKKLRNMSCESALWGALIWNMAQPLPTAVAHDLIDRHIALTDLEHSRQTDEIQWRLAENQREALLTLAIDLYTQSNYSETEFQTLLQKFPNSRWMLETLAYRKPSSPTKEQAFLATISRHPEVEKIQRRHRLHKLVNRAYEATEIEEIEALYAEKEPSILRGLAENPHTSSAILEELASTTGQIRHFAKETLRHRKRAEKQKQQPTLSGMSADALTALTDLAYWASLPASARESTAHTLAEKLPKTFQYQGMETCELGQQRHEIAFYRWNDIRFALIPGSTAALGFDKSASRFPNESQQDNWQQTEIEFSISLNEFLESSLTSPHEIDIKPFLMQVAPSRLAETVDWQLVTERISKHGFRLPTPDEWEYACGAGSQTLFRWGDTCPLDALPIDKAAWNLHQQPNAFGLRMPSDPYRWELTAEPGVLRGGDGGSTICGGMGELAGWLPLATAFTVTWEDESEIIGAYLRRVFPLY